MKMYLIAIAALAATIGTASAEFESRNHDLRDSDTYDGKYSRKTIQNYSDSNGTYALQADQDASETHSIFELREKRRIEERGQNGLSGRGYN